MTATLRRRPAERPGGAVSAGYGASLTLTVTLAVAAFLVLMPVVMLASHPREVLVLGTPVVKQSQGAKTALYIVYLALLAIAVTVVPRLADAVARGPNARTLPALSAALAGSLAAVLIVIRLSHSLPWGDGLRVLLAGAGLWSLAAAAVLWRAIGPRPWPPLGSLQAATPHVSLAAAALAFGVVVCVTSSTSLHPLPLVIGAMLGGAAALAVRRARLPRVTTGAGRAIDVAVVLALALAIPNLVVFTASPGLPNIFFFSGLIQNQQDYLLGSANQLLGGGALLVGVPPSQYGVGLEYFLYAWFHIVPIGYGTLGFLDGLVTALFYIAAYAVLRIAGVTRLLAASAIAVALLALVYGLQYAVGSLPETGPLRFGLPIGLLAARVAEARWPARPRAARWLGLGVVAVASVWSFEAFAYTAVMLAAIVAAQAWLLPSDGRRAWLGRQLAQALGAFLAAHLVLIAATLAATGQLPDWGQYLAYIRSFLLGGRAGVITYDFARWSPGLAVGAAALASAAAVALLARRAPVVARREPALLVALAGSTGYALALLSYTDNRSATYLLPYVTLPLLIAATLWLALLLRGREAAAGARRGGLAFAGAVAVLMVAAAWPAIGRNFSQTLLRHAYPGGGARAALHRLWHPPAIDPRAPVGVRLLDRYVPGRRALILLPTVPDLAVEILMRARRSSSMFITDPIDDGLVPSVWLPKLRSQVAQLRTGQRLLIDGDSLRVLADLRSHPRIDPVQHPLDLGDQEDEWLLKEIGRHFEIRPIYRDPGGLIVAELAAR